jgi:hypothetical protein
MKIKTQICNGKKELEKFLNDELDYKMFRPESVILGITQDRMYYTVIYKDLNDE